MLDARFDGSTSALPPKLRANVLERLVGFFSAPHVVFVRTVDAGLLVGIWLEINGSRARRGEAGGNGA